METQKSKEAEIWIDVRTRGEYRSGHIRIDPPSQIYNIPVDEVEYKISEFIPDKNTKFYIYCLSGSRVDYAAMVLKSQGYVNLVNKGSIYNLLGEGYQIVAE